MNTPPLPKWADVFVLPVLNLLMAFVVCGVIIAIIGENPFDAMRVMIQGAFFYPGSMGYTLYYTTNFIFTGLAVAVAFHAAQFNIGGEGQAYIAGLGAGLVALALAPYLPMVLIIPLCIIGAMIFGGVWGFIPGYLEAYRGSHIVITTIMLNFIAAAIMVQLLGGVLIAKGQQSPQSDTFAESAHLPKIHEIANALGFEMARSSLNLAFVLALLALVFVWVLIWKTRLGYQIRTVGFSPEAARYAGINVGRVITITMAISGGLASLLAINELLGVQHKILVNFTAGYGFTGIAVALMGRNHPIGIFFASLLFGALIQGGAELDFEFSTISREMVQLIQGLIILFSGALAYMFSTPLARLLGRFFREADNG